MYKFGFHKSDDETNGNNKITDKQWFEATEIEVNADAEIYNKIKECSTKTFECSNIIFQYISSADVIDKLKETQESTNSILRAETDHSDLVTAEYEGGLKIWECTSDLITYFKNAKINFANKKVLDLGCGAGLLGIYAILDGSLVDFQDYNKEVIEYTTIPNVLLNVKNDELKSCKFYSGDWKSFMKLSKSKYDYIITSETIYNPDNYEKLYDSFDQLLKENGEVYLGAKTYYFGVGGGIRQFEELINRKGLFTSNVVWKNSEGVQREILRLVKNK